MLVDLRKINNLISDDYINNNHTVSTLSDAAQHLAGKKLFCKLDCSQAFHVMQMADQKSVELLAFNFASRTFANLRLAQGLSRSLSSFSSFMREYLDRVINADKCAQYVDDIEIATHTAEELMTNLREVFQCIRKAGLRLTRAKCQFRALEIDFLGRTVSPGGNAPSLTRSETTFKKCRFQKPRKAYRGTSVLLIITVITYPVSPKKLLHSTTSSKQTSRSKLTTTSSKPSTASTKHWTTRADYG